MESRKLSLDDVTPDMAMAELARRAAAREELNRRNSFMGQAEKVPGYALGAAVGLPGQLMNLAKQVPGAAEKAVIHPLESLQDVGGGVARGAQNLAAALGEGGQGIASFLTGGRAPRVNIREQLGLEGDNQVDLGKMIQSKNPNALLSGLGQYGLGGAAGGSRLLPMIAANSANAAAQAPPGQRLKAGVEGGVGIGLPAAILKAGNAMRPSRMLAGNLSPEELQQNLKSAQGTTTGLGDVIQSPALKRFYENVLTRVPFSGASQKMQGTAQQIIGKGENILDKLQEGLPEGDKTEILQTALKQASTDATKAKNANYQQVNDIADNVGLKVNRENFKQKASEILQRINSTPDLKRELDSGFVADIQHYANPETQRLSPSALSEPVEKNLSSTNILKGKLNDKANDHYSSGRNFEYGQMKELRDSLGQDIEDSIANSKSDDLKNAYTKAQTEYAQNYKPFEDPDIVKFTKQGGDPDLLLSHFLKTGANDRPILLSKILDKLPSKTKDLPAYMYLSKAIEDGQLNPMKMRTLYNKLGDKQANLLISDPEMSKAIKDYTKNVEMNTQAFQTMFNPHTGQRLSDVIPMAGSVAGYSLLGGGLPGAIGAIGGAVLPGLAGKGAVSLLTSPKVREGLVKAIIKSKQKQK